MSENIILRNNPRTEFQFFDDGFKIIEKQAERNNGFYSFSDVQSIELNKLWYPRLVKWLRNFPGWSTGLHWQVELRKKAASVDSCPFKFHKFYRFGTSMRCFFLWGSHPEPGGQ